LHQRAEKYLAVEAAQLNQRRIELGVADEVVELEDVSLRMAVAFGENGVRSLDDVGDLASDELLDLLGNSSLEPAEADAIIMAARAHWFDDEELAAADEEAEPAEGEAAPEAGEADA
jgi:N utilization substance protein A